MLLEHFKCLPDFLAVDVLRPNESGKPGLFRSPHISSVPMRSFELSAIFEKNKPCLFRRTKSPAAAFQGGRRGILCEKTFQGENRAVALHFALCRSEGGNSADFIPLDFVGRKVEIKAVAAGGVDGGVLGLIGVVDHAVLVVGNVCVNLCAAVGAEPGAQFGPFPPASEGADPLG